MIVPALQEFSSASPGSHQVGGRPSGKLTACFRIWKVDGRGELRWRRPMWTLFPHRPVRLVQFAVLDARIDGVGKPPAVSNRSCTPFCQCNEFPGRQLVVRLRASQGAAVLQ